MNRNGTWTPALGAQILNHWTTGEVLACGIFKGEESVFQQTHRDNSKYGKMLNVGGVCTGSHCVPSAFHMCEVFFMRVGGEDKLY